jgi:hypothetical protein
MDVVLIFNGLGNQMSQYAFYLKKRQISGSARFTFLKKSAKVHNGYELDKVFGIKKKATVGDKIVYFIYLVITYSKLAAILQPIVRLSGLLGLAVINENDDYTFHPKLLQPSRGIKYYVGGWHSEKYFIDVKDKVLHEFQFDYRKIGTANMEVLAKIRASNSVSVHVRRGDFLDPENYQKFGSICTLDYFLSAIRKMRSLVDNPHFFFFTNDFPWVIDNFVGDDFTMVNINFAGDSWKDMLLISNCSHNINSNGSFSWWSSYLNKNTDKIVIVPKNFIANKYIEDVYPEDWIQLSDY